MSRQQRDTIPKNGIRKRLRTAPCRITCRFFKLSGTEPNSPQTLSKGLVTLCWEIVSWSMIEDELCRAIGAKPNFRSVGLRLHVLFMRQAANMFVQTF